MTDKANKKKKSIINEYSTSCTIQPLIHLIWRSIPTTNTSPERNWNHTKGATSHEDDDPPIQTRQGNPEAPLETAIPTVAAQMHHENGEKPNCFWLHWGKAGPQWRLWRKDPLLNLNPVTWFFSDFFPFCRRRGERRGEKKIYWLACCWWNFIFHLLLRPCLP